MDCRYYRAGQCVSCRQLPIPYAQQLADKQQRLETLLQPFGLITLLAPATGALSGFRNKAKMVVQGSAESPVLGIVNPQKQAIDLSDCPLYPESFSGAFSLIRAFITQVGMQPYDIAARCGELKYVLLSHSDYSGKWMLRFVLRSQKHVASLRKHLPSFMQAWPELQVVSVNLQPIPQAVLEGDTEIILTDETMLAEKLNDVVLYTQPQSFFQTNNGVAAQLYQAAREWTAPLDIDSCWDLFCGVGGFALHLANPQTKVTGIEISASAIACASRGAKEAGLKDFHFQALDSDAFASAQAEPPALMVVNPPRRGLGKGLCESITQLQPQWLLYSSCNPDSLVADIGLLADYQLEKAQLFDMFPHTHHAEVLTLLKRR